MNDKTSCPGCGKPLAPDSPEGLCPACLMRLALAAPSAGTEGDAPTVARESSGEAGLRFGPYTTIRMLGEGGMGIVYLARQEEPIQRTVALKVIKPGLDSRQVMARFETERQALAVMDHQNIARVFDAGTSADGRPYFVMEYVPGVPITNYCDGNHLSTRERLDLFQHVCLAVHHAHQKGIIHRDLKPTNILVEVQDAKPVPKVIDFGVAKATNQRLTERTIFTEQGMLVGTPEYMSPEQAEASGEDVDTASDIYSLGVLLYELLVGALPFDWKRLRRAGYLEILRVIREEEPSPPLGKLKTLGATATEIATRRHTDVHSLGRQIRGDLEWITMRAMEKDRRRRYASASELAADVQRHLSDEPVLAGPVSRLYRLRKFVRKNRLPVAAAAAIAVCLIAGLTVSSVLYVREQRQRDVAERESYLANLANADALIEACDYAGAWDRLFRCAPRLRGWEWRMLFAQADTTVARLQGAGDPDPGYPGVVHFAFSPGARRLYCAMTRTVHAWEASSWQHVADYGVFEHIIGIARDGSRAVTRPRRQGEPPALAIIEPSTGRRLASLGEHLGAGWAAFSPDGTLVATSSTDTSVKIWDAASGKLLATAAGEGKSLYPRLAFSPDSRRLAATGTFGVLRMLDARTGRQIWGRKVDTGAIFGLAFSPDGTTLAAAHVTVIRLWDAASGEKKLEWKEIDGVFSTEFSPDGRRLVTAAQSGAIRLWDPATGKAMATLAGDRVARTAAFSPDGKWVVAASPAAEIWVWDLATCGGTELARSRSRGAMMTSVAVSPDGAAVAAAMGTAMLIEASSGRHVWEVPGINAAFLSFSPGGDRVVVGSYDGMIRVLDSRNGTTLISWSAHKGGVRTVAYSPNGRLIATGALDNTARIWDAATGKSLATMQFAGRVNRVAFSPDGQRLATAAGNPGFGGVLDGVRVWEALSGKLVYKFTPQPGVFESAGAVAFSPDGRRLASVETYSGTVRVAEAATGKVIAVMKDHQNEIRGLAFSPDGGRIATSARDNTIRVWDASRHELLFSLRRPAVMPMDVAFSPDGFHLYAGYLDGTLRKWSAASRHPVQAAEMVAQLTSRYSLMADLRRHLEDDRSLDDAARRAVLRAGADQADWNSDGMDSFRASLMRPAAAARDATLMLRRAEDFHRTSPWSVYAWVMLGAALYRNGQYQEATGHLARASEKSEEAESEAFLGEAFLAMSYQRTGQAEKARQALENAGVLLKQAGASRREAVAGVLQEAEALIGGKTR